jgi:membrane-bound lytic murein transglycosylase D
MNIRRPNRLRAIALAAALFAALPLACATASASRPSPAAAATSAHPLSAQDAQALQRVLAELGAAGPLPAKLEENVAQRLAALRAEERAAVEERRARVWPAIRRALAAEHLPEALGALAYVESRFDASVRGSECAGLWQFTAQTARSQGLRVDAELDERLDAEKSSRAAAHYLRALVDELGGDSPLLAVAAYNAGENKIRGALKSSSEQGGPAPRAFWTLVERGLLSEETASYVPKFLAAAIALLPDERRL